MAVRRQSSGGSDPWSLSQRNLEAYGQETENMRKEADLRRYQRDVAPNVRRQNIQIDNEGRLAAAEGYNAAGFGPTGRSNVAPTKNSLDVKGSLNNPFAQEFMGTIAQAGVTNPYALAAIAATVKAESGWTRVHDEWNDPSEKGVPGRSGLAMSWRDARLKAARNYARSAGDDPQKPGAATQARFFLQENPALIQRLNNAPDLASAVRYMRDAWQYADKGGAQTQIRLGYASQYLPLVGGRNEGNKGFAANLAQLSTPTEVDRQVFTDENGEPYTLKRMDSTQADRLNKQYIASSNGVGTGYLRLNPDGSESGKQANYRDYETGKTLKAQLAAQPQTVDNPAPDATMPAPPVTPTTPNTPLSMRPDNPSGVTNAPLKAQVRRVVQQPQQVAVTTEEEEEEE